MVNQLNLSSRPFRNSTLPWLISVLLRVLSFIGAVFVLSNWRQVRVEASVVRDGINKLEPQIRKLDSEIKSIKESIAPEQRRLLVAAHTLVARKRFSWSRLFVDLENVLPRAVSVSHISVRDVYQDRDRTVAELEFAVLSRDYQAVLEMINSMNNSSVFQAALRGQDLQRDKGNLTEYTIQLRYSPSYGIPVKTSDAESALTTAQIKTEKAAWRNVQ